MAVCTKSSNDSKHWNRINGWSFPLHFLQLIAWLFIFTFALLYFGVMVPNLPIAWQISASVINGIVFFIHVVVHLISISLNPADPNVRAKNYRGPLPYFDRSQHAHVIENQFCYICEVKVGIHSKHCSACNKCVSGFDHHCKWLNNCIGNRNYRLFICCVSTALIGCLLVFVASCTLVGAYFCHDSWLYATEQMAVTETTMQFVSTTQSTDLTSMNGTLETTTEFFEYSQNNKTLPEVILYIFVPVNNIVWIVVIILTLNLSLVASGLLTHLLGFHVYLMCIGNSTYEYIIHKRDNEEYSSQGPCCKFNCQGSFFKKLLLKKANQISPTSNGKDISDDNEFAMKPTSKHQSKNINESVSIPVLDVTPPKEKSSHEKSLENYVGNVYLGSPERQRHFLEPIYVNNRRSKRVTEESKNQMETVLSEEKSISNSEMVSNNDKELSSSTSHLNVSGRKRHPSASPATLLPPIMETENIESPSLSKWYRSVSAQSLNSLSDTDDFRSLSSNKDGAILPGLAKRVNSSLSNLLFSMEGSHEINSDPNDSDDEASCQNYTQSTDTKDSDLYTTNVSSSELINENEEESNDFNTNSNLSDKEESNDQWANYVSKKKYYLEDKPNTNGVIEENMDEVKIPGLGLSRSSSQNDLGSEHFNGMERKFSLTEKPPISKNNFFSAPLFRPTNNSKVIMIGNTCNKDDSLNDTNKFYNNQANNLSDNSEVTVFDSVVFDTQRSYSNITPVV